MPRAPRAAQGRKLPRRWAREAEEGLGIGEGKGVQLNLDGVGEAAELHLARLGALDRGLQQLGYLVWREARAWRR